MWGGTADAFSEILSISTSAHWLDSTLCACSETMEAQGLAD